MKNILVDTMLYNPSIFVYNISDNFANVYNVIDNKVLKVKIKLDKTNYKYIIINNETYYLKYMFDLSINYLSNKYL